MLRHEIAQRLVVLPQIAVQLVYPLLALVVCRHEGHRAEGVEVAHLVDVDGAVQPAARGSVGADDVGRLQSGDVERLRRRVQHDGRCIDRLHGAERVAGHHQLAVYLVAHDAHGVAVADVAHALQLLARPYTARGVVRIAEQEYGAFLVGTALLEVVPVHFEAVAVQPQHTLGHLAAVVAHAAEEAVVVGRQDEHALAGHRQGLDGTRHGGHHTGGI